MVSEVKTEISASGRRTRPFCKTQKTRLLSTLQGGNDSSEVGFSPLPKGTNYVTTRVSQDEFSLEGSPFL